MDTNDAGSQAKVKLRAAMKARRATLSAAERAAGADAVARTGIAFLAPAPGAIVSGFLPIGDEFDTAPLLGRLHAAGYLLCLPVMQGRDRELLFRVWAPGDTLAVTVWGIREPTPDKPVLEPDVLLVPLLAVDRAGWRLGYGGGYYDRTIRKIRALRAAKPVLTVGLAFDAQVVDAVPHLDYDERLDWLLTPSGPLRCSS